MMKINRLFSFAAASLSANVTAVSKEENQQHANIGLKEAQTRSAVLVERLMNEVGAPGVVVAVSIDGNTVWSRGFGFADVENRVPCRADSVMRVASISKSFTAAAMARLWEDGKLDLDRPVQDYVPEFPEKHFEGSKVVLTLRQLLSHTSGIRHYRKSLDKESNNKQVKDEFELEEYFSTKPYKSVIDSLSLFKGDPLLKKPGKHFLYTTHGWTLVSAIMERASGKDFLILMSDMFRRMGMSCTVPDFHQPIIYGRARYYWRKKGKLLNAPYVDNSYKWAGGGFLSTVGDLIKFGNVMMYCFQQTDETKESNFKGFLRSDTVQKMWNIAIKPKRTTPAQLENGGYGLGWAVFSEMESIGCCPDVPFEVTHSGGAIGASSVLFLVPDTRARGNLGSQEIVTPAEKNRPKARGIAVAIICNLQAVGLTGLARAITREFEQLRQS